MTIFNAKDNPIGMPFLPNVSDALDGLSQPTSIFRVTKTVLPNGEISEQLNPYSFDGVFQPMKAFEISLKPEGQRQWRWYNLHSKTGLPLSLDDILYYLNSKYRVAGIWDYNQFGYYQYELVQDFSDRASPMPLPNQDAINKFLQDIVVSSPLNATITVSPQIPDATVAAWALYAPTGQKIDNVPGTVKILSPTQVMITVQAPGTYRLIGES